MLKNKPLQQILDLARKEETQYRWLQSIQFYRDALDYISTQQKCADAGEVTEKIGFCFHRAAMQADTREEFKKRIENAIKAYAKLAS